MNFEDVKNLKCPELIFKPIEVINTEVKWGGVIDLENPLFKPNYSEEQLKTLIVPMPVFTDEEMIGMPYTETKWDKEIEHETHCNYVDYSINYQKVHIVKITQSFGVKVLKQSEEKFCTKIELETNVFYFKYEFEKDRWVRLNKPDLYEQEKPRIDVFCNSEEVRELHKNYFEARNSLKREVEFASIRDESTYNNVLTGLQHLIDCAKSFHGMKNYLREISDFAYEKMNALMLDVEKKLVSVREATDDLNLLHSIKQTNRSDEENKLIELYADLLNRMKTTFFVAGYWINEDEIYPNICEFYKLKQKSETNRNADTKNALKKKILSESYLSKASFVTI